MNEVLKIPALKFPVQAELSLPGSKSQANRAIICAALAEGVTEIQNATSCDDVAVMIENLQKMGFNLEWKDQAKGDLRIKGSQFSLTPDPSHDGGWGKKSPFSPREKGLGMRELDCNNAGTTLRFLTSLACLIPGEWTITGDENMRCRPIADLTAALRLLGADIKDTNGCPPVRIRGGTLRGGRVKLKAALSSQYLSSLLLVAPKLAEGLKIELDGRLASSGYIDLTRKVMNDFGVQIFLGNGLFQVNPGKYTAKTGGYEIEGDWSAAGAWLVLNSLTGSSVSFFNLNPESQQSDKKIREAIEIFRKPGDLTFDASSVPDQVMNLAVLAAFRSGKTEITGAKNLRFKETNRLRVLASELKKAGIDILESEDGLTIRNSNIRDLKTRNQKPETRNLLLDSHDDHRMAMCFAILGLIRGDVSIRNPECVSKSYPDFFRHLSLVSESPQPIVIVGMRGAGKSHFGRRLAQKLKLRHIDADRVFEKKFGVIRSFVESKGWPAFRSREEQIISENMRPGTILSCGGGAVESEKTREILKKKSICIWVQASERELLKRLQSGKRPALTRLPLRDELKMFVKKRTPFYREVSRIVIPPNLPFSRQIPFAMKKLETFEKPGKPKKFCFTSDSSDSSVSSASSRLCS